MNRLIHKKTWLTALAVLAVALPAAVVLPGCTDLDEETFGVITPDTFYSNEDEIVAGLAPVYAQLRSTLDNYHNLSQVTSDETVVPTRGSDWYDNGAWLALHRQTWDPAHGDFNNAWNNAYTGVARANGLLQILEEDPAGREGLIAELRGLRAFYYYQLLDLFGNVPVVGDEAGEYLADAEDPPATEPRQAVFDFVVSELQAVRDELPTRSQAAGWGRITRGAADAMLANLYLNAGVFSTDSPNATSYNSCADVTIGGQNACQLAAEAAQRVISAGDYALADDWKSIFAPDNAENVEHIFVIPYLPEIGLGLNFIHRALHYNQFTPSPWNGFATLAETYYAFDENDLRRDIFLAGEQFNVETGEPIDNRQGERLNYTPEIGDVTNAAEGEGVRIYKFPADPNHVAEHNGNDYPLFRLGEMYLIRAEALNELNGPNAESISLLNDLRARVFEPDQPLSLGDYGSRQALRDAILQERLFELTYEAKRRQDLIRHGRFTQPWSFKNQSEPHRVLFPIPQPARDANPNLDQNPGY